MRHDHLKRELELLLLLTQNRQYTPDEICERLDISRRSLYYYLEFFRDAGFKVEKYKKYYYISRQSEFFRQLNDLVQFTDEEVILIRQLIEKSDATSVRIHALKKKLERFYDFKILEDEGMQQRVSRTLSRLIEAIKSRKVVRIVNYSSNNSRSVSDRIVEPFLFMNNNNDVRCYELASKTNKTFRLSRMESVEVLDTDWIHEDQHRRVYTDMFMFSGEEHYPVHIILGQMAHNLMLEEYPVSAPCMALREDGRWTFKTEVCSYLGIGRFVLGLYEDIEVVGDEGFKKYLAEKIERMYGNR